MQQKVWKSSSCSFLQFLVNSFRHTNEDSSKHPILKRSSFLIIPLTFCNCKVGHSRCFGTGLVSHLLQPRLYLLKFQACKSDFYRIRNACKPVTQKESEAKYHVSHPYKAVDKIITVSILIVCFWIVYEATKCPKLNCIRYWLPVIFIFTSVCY